MKTFTKWCGVTVGVVLVGLFVLGFAPDSSNFNNTQFIVTGQTISIAHLSASLVDSGMINAGQFPALSGIITTPGGSLVTSFGTFTSATLRSAISDESGNGAALFANGNIGAATGTSLNLSGTATANLFSGSGASLSALNASQLTSGTIPDAAFGNLTGDATSVGHAVTFATVNSGPGTFGDGTDVAITTVNAKGLATSVSSTPITGVTYPFKWVSTTNYVLSKTDHFIECGGTNQTITLPNGTNGVAIGIIYTIIQTNVYGSVTVTNANGLQLVLGANAQNAQGGLTVAWDGVVWSGSLSSFDPKQFVQTGTTISARTNSQTTAGVVTPGNGSTNLIWGTDSNGNPGWVSPVGALSAINIATSGYVSSTNGFVSMKSSATAPTGISFPNTTVNWTNTQGFNIVMYIDNSGVTGTAVKKNGTTVFTSITGDCTLMMKPGDYFSETYSLGTPVGNWEPQ